MGRNDTRLQSPKSHFSRNRRWEWHEGTDRINIYVIILRQQFTVRCDQQRIQKLLQIINNWIFLG